MVDVDFKDPSIPRDGDLELRLRETASADIVPGFVPAYHFDMIDRHSNAVVGKISLRLGDTHFLTHFGGQIAYGVKPERRGHRHAAARVGCSFRSLTRMALIRCGSPATPTTSPREEPANSPAAK